MSSQHSTTLLEHLRELDQLELWLRHHCQELASAIEELSASKRTKRLLRELRLIQAQDMAQVMQLTLQCPTVGERRWLLQACANRALTPSEEQLLRRHHWSFCLATFVAGLVCPSIPRRAARVMEDLRDQAQVERLQRLADAQNTCKRIEWELREDVETPDEWEERWRISRERHLLRLTFCQTLQVQALLAADLPQDEATDESPPKTETDGHSSSLVAVSRLSSL